MTEEEKKAIRREKHPGCASQGHKLAALMQKRKEEILPNKEQSTEQSTVQTTIQSTIQLNDTYIYGFGILAVLATRACLFFAYSTSQAANKKQVNEKQQQPPKRRNML